MIKKLPSYNVFIYLNKSLIYYYQNDYKTHQKKNHQKAKGFLLLDKSFQLKILVANLMIRILVCQMGLDKKIEQKMVQVFITKRGSYKRSKNDRYFI